MPTCIVVHNNHALITSNQWLYVCFLSRLLFCIHQASITYSFFISFTVIHGISIVPLRHDRWRPLLSMWWFNRCVLALQRKSCSWHTRTSDHLSDLYHSLYHTHSTFYLGTSLSLSHTFTSLTFTHLCQPLSHHHSLEAGTLFYFHLETCSQCFTNCRSMTEIQRKTDLYYFLTD